MGPHQLIEIAFLGAVHNDMTRDFDSTIAAPSPTPIVMLKQGLKVAPGCWLVRPIAPSIQQGTSLQALLPDLVIAT